MVSHHSMTHLLALRPSSLWHAFQGQRAYFWMACGYLAFEYFRFQSILPGLDIVPWTQFFLVAAICLRLLAGNSPRAAPSLLPAWLIIFLIVVLLSSFFAFIPSAAYRNLDQYYLWLIIILIVRATVDTEQALFIFLLIFYLAGLKLSTFGARTFAFRGFAFTSWGLYGPPGYFTNSSEYAAQMSVFFGFSVYVYLALRSHVSRWTKYFLMVGPVTSLVAVIGASSRGAQLAIAVQVYFIFLHGRIRVRSLVIATAVVLLSLSLLPDEQKQRFTAIGDDRTSQQRLLYWEHGIDMVKRYPALGVGHFNFAPYYNAYFPEDVLYERAQLAHNIFIQVGADLGLIGLSVYLVLIWYGFYIPRRVRQILAAAGRESDWRFLVSKGLVVGFIGYLVAGQFVSIAYYPYHFIHLAFCLALLNSLRDLPQNKKGYSSE